MVIFSIVTSAEKVNKEKKLVNAFQNIPNLKQINFTGVCRQFIRLLTVVASISFLVREK